MKTSNMNQIYRASIDTAGGSSAKAPKPETKGDEQGQGEVKSTPAPVNVLIEPNVTVGIELTEFAAEDAVEATKALINMEVVVPFREPVATKWELQRQKAVPGPRGTTQAVSEYPLYDCVAKGISFKIAFITSDDPDAYGERIHQFVADIVGLKQQVKDHKAIFDESGNPVWVTMEGSDKVDEKAYIMTFKPTVRDRYRNQNTANRGQQVGEVAEQMWWTPANGVPKLERARNNQETGDPLRDLADDTAEVRYNSATSRRNLINRELAGGVQTLVEKTAQVLSKMSRDGSNEAINRVNEQLEAQGLKPIHEAMSEYASRINRSQATNDDWKAKVEADRAKTGAVRGNPLG